MTRTNYILETPFIILLYALQDFLFYTLPLSKTLQTADCDFLSALNHISNIVAQLKDMRNKSQDTSCDISELASRKVESLGEELKTTK
jgi:hypothetical protein